MSNPPQHDLFASLPPAAVPQGNTTSDPILESFVNSVRDELLGLMELARKAERLPWSDYTQSALAEMRVESLCNWLPHVEAEQIKSVFAQELDRLYALDEAR